MGKFRPTRWGTLKATSRGLAQRSDRLGKVAEKQKLDGKTFASKLEAAVYLLLKAEEAAGLITDLKTQHNVTLVAGIRMIPDFSYIRDGKREFCEAKGFVTDAWAIKLRLWRNGFGPGVLRIFKGSYNRPVEVERVIPKAIDCNGTK